METSTSLWKRLRSGQKLTQYNLFLGTLRLGRLFQTMSVRPLPPNKQNGFQSSMIKDLHRQGRGVRLHTQTM